jgi:radical SAM superfamily enzyme YgiQ (UPF0313 family)
MDWREITLARRLLASERGAIVQDWGGRLPIVLAYPNSYAVGMSSLAIHGLYRWFNALPGVLCERAFAWLGRRFEPGAPLLTLESQRPVRDAAALAISVSFEMDYFHLLEMLRRVPVPLRAAERQEGDPLVILGGPAVAANPAPLSVVADAIVIGEAEPVLADLVDVLRAGWARDRAGTLAALAALPGVFVPAFHDGRPIERLCQGDLDAYPTATSVIAPQAEFGDMFLIEISRGCMRGCRFCLAGQWYRPMRERRVESILAQARDGMRELGKVGLVGAAVSDYAEIDALVAQLREMGAAISVSSLRVHPLSLPLIDALAESGSQSITLAPEAGSERLRRAIRKGVTHEQVIQAVEAVRGRFASLKLYFMVGLPGEQEADIDELLQLVGEVAGLFDRQVVVNVTPFVPKAHTPYEREAMAFAEVLESRLARLREGCRALRVEFRAEGVAEARVQGVLARGDTRLGEILVEMPTCSPARLSRALQRAGIAPEDYLGQRSTRAPLPWDFVRAPSQTGAS